MRDRQYPLYHEELEHDSCGVGAVVDLNAKATHRTVDQALCIVERLAHRAGSDAQGTTGDGVGIMTQLPHTLFAAWAREEGIALGNPGDYGVGMFFLPEDEVGARNTAGSWRNPREFRFSGGGRYPATRPSWVPARGGRCRVSDSVS